MRRPIPTTAQIETLREGVKRDGDRVCDYLSLVVEEAMTPLPSIGGVPRPGGTHSDPTAARAIRSNTRAQTLADRMTRWLTEGIDLAAEAEAIVGPLVCAGCGQDMRPGQPVYRLHGQMHHGGKCKDAIHNRNRFRRNRMAA